MIISLSNQKILKKFLKINFYIFIIVNTGNLAQLAYQIFGGKILTPDNYGILTSANSLIGLLALPIAILFNYAVRILIQKKTKLNKKKFLSFFNLLNSYFIIIGIIIFFLINLFGSFFQNLLTINSNEVIIIIALTIFFNLLSLPYIALNQSNKKYKLVSLIGSSHHFIRLILFLILFYFISRSYISGLYANLFSFMIITILAFFTVKHNYKLRVNFNLNYFKKFKLKKFINSNIDSFSNIKSSAISNLFLTLMTSVDVIIFRKLFPNELSGFYSAISTLGKIPLFLSAILFTYFLTESSYNFFRNDKSKSILYFNLTVNLIIFTFFIITFYIFGEQILLLLFNSQYILFSDDLYYLTLAFTFVGFIKIIIIYFFTKNKNDYALTLLIGLLLVLIFCSLSETYKDFIETMVIGYMFLFLIMLGYLIKDKN